jgi:hypothetical protein
MLGFNFETSELSQVEKNKVVKPAVAALLIFFIPDPTKKRCGHKFYKVENYLIF